MHQSVNSVEARWGYPVWYDWKQSPPWSEISGRVNSLLRRGATSIYIYDVEVSSDDFEIVIVDGELSANEATEAFNAWLATWWDEVDEEQGFDWETRPEPFPVPGRAGIGNSGR